MKTRYARGMAALVFVCALGAAAPSDAGNKPGAGKQIGQLIAKLSAPDFGVRTTSFYELLDIGSAAETALTEAMKDKTLSKEGRERIGYILDNLDVPGRGIVWRGRHGEQPPAGIQDGDVVTAIDGRPVKVWYQLWTIDFDRRHGQQLAVWRKGKGNFSLTSHLDRQMCGGFAEWPDLLEMYRRYGQKGRWTANVQKAMRASLGNRPAAQLFSKVVKLGCRDALVLRLYLRELRQLPDRKAAEKVLALCAGEVKGNYPGGDVEHGRLPREIVLYLLSTGKREQAKAYLAEAIKQARQAEAWMGLLWLRRMQVGMSINESPAKARALWNDHRALMPLGGNYHGLVEAMTHHFAADGDPSKAVAFLQDEPPVPIVKRLREVFSRQVRAAEQFRRIKVPPHKVLVRYMPELGPVSSPVPNVRERLRVMVLPSPGAVECEMRIVRVSQREKIGHGEVEFGVRGSGERTSVTKLRDGSSSHMDSHISYEVDLGTGTATWVPGCIDAFDWTGVSVDLLPGITRVRVDGRPRRAVYHPYRGPGLFRAETVVENCSAEFRNIKGYVFSSVKVDNDVLEKSFVAFTEAAHASNLKQARRQHSEIERRLAKVPEAKSVRGEMRTDMRLFEKVMTKDGLDLCTDDILQRAVRAGRMHPHWELKNGSLTVAKCPRCSTAMLYFPLLAPDDIEITGVVEVAHPQTSTSVSFTWNGADPKNRVSVVFWPKIPKARLGGWAAQHKEAKKVDFSTPLPFCVRTKGNKAALFLRFGARPDLQLSGLRRTGNIFYIQSGWLGDKTRVRISKLRIRHLPKGTRLDAPVRMPKVEATKAATAPGGQDW